MSTEYLKRDFHSSEGLALRSLGASQPVYRTISHRAVAPIAMFCDAFIIISMSVLSGVAYKYVVKGFVGDVTQIAVFATVGAALFVSFGKSYDIYKLSELLNLKSQIRRVTITWAVVLLFLTAVVFLLKTGHHFSRGSVLLFAGSTFTALIAVRGVWRVYLADGLAVSRFSNRKIALIAQQSPEDTAALLASLLRHGQQPAHQFILPVNRDAAKYREQVIAQAIATLRGSDIEEIVIATDLDDWPELSDLLSELRVLPLPVNLIPTGQISELFRLPSHTIGNTVNIELQRGPRTLLERAVKRTLDLVIASIALLLLLPMFLAAALAIKLDSFGPVIFRQRRRGFNGRLFQILKFRTMSVLEDDDEHVIPAQRNDIRVTAIGNWLRRTSIDELPQVINVLGGSMSIVGPRPHAMAHDNRFDKIIGNYAYRHHVKPGLTGWAQVHGYRGQIPTIEDLEQRIKLDLWYIDNWSLALDLKILFMTVVEVLSGKNAY